MRGDVYVSGGGKLLRLTGGETAAQTPIADCGAVCAHEGAVYASSERDGVIYRLDERLLPCGVFAGGPGMRELRLSGDGRRLYALVADADSVLMLDASDGAPQFLARAGASPCRMRLDEAEGTLTVAGGRDGSASVLCAKTLDVLCAAREDGVCCDALRMGGMLCLLLLTPTLNAQLAVVEGDRRWRLGFPGLPGALCRAGRTLLLSAGEWLYAIDPVRRKARRKIRLPCAAGKLLTTENGLLLLSPLDETLYVMGRDGGARLLCRGARDAATE